VSSWPKRWLVLI